MFKKEGKPIVNVAVVTSPLAPHNKSIETCLIDFLELIESFSNQIYVYTGNFQSDYIFRKICVESIKYDNKKNPQILRVIKYVLMQVRLAYNLFKTRQKNVNITIFYIGSTLLLPFLVAKLLKQKTIIVATGSVSKSMGKSSSENGPFAHYFFKLIERLIFSLTDRIAVESQSVIGFLELKRHRKKVIVGFARHVQISLFNIKKVVSQRQNLIVFVGRISREKGVLNLVEAIPKVLAIRNDLSFLLVGNGALFQDIQQRVKKEKIASKVKFTGWVPHDKLPEYLNEAKLLVLPSYSEGLPGVVKEAMACGTPVLATPVGGVPDLVKDGNTGFILSSNDPEQIAIRIIELLSKSELLEKVSTNAHNYVRENFSFEKTLENWQNMFNELLPIIAIPKTK